MSLFPIASDKAQLTTAAVDAGDSYVQGLRLNSLGTLCRAALAGGAQYSNGLLLSNDGQVIYVDATAGLPADVTFHNGLPFSAAGALCISTDAAAGYSNGLPFAANGALSAEVLSLNLDFVSAETLDAAVTFTRASGATRTNRLGVLELMGTDAPRFDYDPVTLAPKGLLIEEQRTNLLLQSAFSTIGTAVVNNAWYEVSTALDTTVNAALAPDGTSTAALLSINVNTSFAAVFQRTANTSDGTYAYSVYCKASSTDTNARLLLAGDSGVTNFIRADFTLSGNGAAGVVSVGGAAVSAAAPSIQFVGNGWYRCTIAATLTAPTGITALVYPGATTSQTTASQTLVWGAQLEAGAFPTSYIPTTTAAATRAADVATITGANFSNWYRQDEGTLFAESSRLSTTAFSTTVSISDGTNNERIRIIGWNDARDFFSVSDGGALQADLNFSSGTTLPTKMAGAYKENDFALSRNGAAAVTDNSGTIPVVNQMILGATLTSFPLNGHIRRISYFPRRLTSSELEGITK